MDAGIEVMTTSSNQGEDFTIATPPSIDCKDICDKLILTYNASLIDNFPADLRASCIKEAKECADAPIWRGDRKRTVLAKLIENYSNEKENPSIYPRYIDGPLNISCHWSTYYQKLIYIFGEFHGNEKDCHTITDEPSVSIEDYLYQHFLKQIAFTDFLVEMHANVDGYSNVSFKQNSRLNRIRAQFQKCVDSKLRRGEEDCNLSRMHYFDIRQGEVKNGFEMDGTTIIRSVNPMSKFISDIGILINQLTFTSNFNVDFIQNVKRLFDFYKSKFDILTVLENCLTNTNQYIDFFLTEFKKYKILKKEIDRSNTSVMNMLNIFIHREMIYMTTFVVEDTDEYQNIVKIPNLKKLEKYTGLFIETYLNIILFHEKYFNPKDITPEDKQGTIEAFDNIKIYLYKMRSIVINYNALIADAYVLARIFKKFNIDTKDPLKRRETDEPEEPRNIIIYAGNGHCQRYRKFLTEYLNFEDKGTDGTGIVNDADIPNEPRYCIDMKNFNQPLFSIWPSSPPSMHFPSPPSSPPCRSPRPLTRSRYS